MKANESIGWRQKFIELAAALRQAADKPAQIFTGRPEVPVGMRFDVDGVLFEMIHFGDAGEAPDRFLLECRWGPMPLMEPAPALEAALTMNHGLARANAGMFSVDAQANELVCTSLQTLRDTTPQGTWECLAQIAAVAKQWRTAHVVLH